MPVHIDDADLEDKIAQVEGDDWRKHHKQWEDMERDQWEPGADGFCTIGGVRTCRFVISEEDEDSLYKPGDRVYGSRVIYGMGGWHRYHVRSTGEVVFSTSHSGRYGARNYGPETPMHWEELERKIRAAGFRLSTEA